MKNIFTQVQNPRLPSNTFDLSHDVKLSAQMGNLVPVLNMDVVPGDTISIKPQAMVRFAPLIAPLMHRVNVYTHIFFVPNRIIWDGWESFITGGEDGQDITPWAFGLHKTDEVERSSLPDYMGLPVDGDQVGGGILPMPEVEVNALPFAAYQKVYNDYYRDQNLQDKNLDKCVDGAQETSAWTKLTTLRRRAWQHDYFTSALPWTQKGPEAMLPLGIDAPIIAKDPLANDMSQFVKKTDGQLLPNSPLSSEGSARLTAGGSLAYVDLSETHFTDLSDATASSINDLRRAFKLQEFLEANARGGTRYNEFLKVHFNVTAHDSRLQRPEYIGGSSTPVQISEVLQTESSNDATTPQGNMAGHAISVGGSQNFTYHVKEHGYILAIMSVMPESAYQQGVPKHFSRPDKFDYYFHQFAHIGEQPILNQEVAVSKTVGYNEKVFGYIPRYAEYKYMPNRVSGDFKSTLDFWHLGRKFNSNVLLNADFITLDPTEVDRIFAVQDGTDNLWCHVYMDIKARRNMPVYGTPKIH